jgi:hypothetical protein
MLNVNYMDIRASNSDVLGIIILSRCDPVSTHAIYLLDSADTHHQVLKARVR